MPSPLRRPFRTRCFAGAALMLVVAAGCAETPLDVYQDTAHFFALHGYLDAVADTQFVRVDPFRRTVEVPDAGALQASVRSVDEATGTVVAWQDSLVRLDDGTTGHLFFAPLQVVPGRDYRLEVEGPGDAVTVAHVHVPAPPPFRTDTLINNASTVAQNVYWVGLRQQPARVTLHYEVALADSLPRVDVAVDYFVRGHPSGDDWRILVNLREDLRTVLTRLGVTLSDPPLLFYGISISVLLVSEGWGVNPVSNVVRGAGFVGAVAPATAHWTLPPEAVAHLGLLDHQGG